MLTPYYDRAGITIYHGNCLDIAGAVGGGDVIVSDPPYGMNYKPLRGSDGSKRFTVGVTGDDAPFDPAPWVVSPCVLWGGNWFADLLPASGGWLVWDKTPFGRKEGFVASDADLAWTNVATRIHKFSFQWGGEAHGGEPHYHPTQKPVALLRWCIGFVPAGVILDPYMGSGSTLLAARDLGRRAIGIEIEERYCEIAATRLAQEVLPMFEPAS